MGNSTKSEQLRVSLNTLDRMLTRGTARSPVRLLAAKVYEGEDIIRGDRG